MISPAGKLQSCRYRSHNGFRDSMRRNNKRSRIVLGLFSFPGDSNCGSILSLGALPKPVRIPVDKYEGRIF